MKKNDSHLLVYAAVCFVVSQLLVSHLVYAQESDRTVEKDAKSIFTSVISPFCPGRLLSDCPSSAAVDLKEDIRSQLKSGRSKEEVVEQLYTTYGDKMRAAPKNEGFGLVAWVMPVCFLLGGLLIIMFTIRKKPQSGEVTAATSEMDSEMQARIDSEISE